MIAKHMIQQFTISYLVQNHPEQTRSQHSMDAEDADKILQFLDLNIKKVERKYVTSIYRKKAITKVQVKPHPMILKGIFTGYIHRTYAICQPIQREEEINFLIRCFTENRYNNNKLKRIAERYHQKNDISI